MPRIPTLDRSQSIIPVSGSVPRNINTAGAAGAGLQQLSQGLGRAGEAATNFAERQEEADANAWVSETTASAQREWRQRFEKAREEAAPGADGFTPQLIGDYEKWTVEALKAAPNDLAREAAEQRFRQLGTALFDDAVAFEGRARRAQRAEGFERSVQDLEASLFAAPERFGQIVGQAQGDLAAADATWMTPQERSVYSDLPSRLAEAAMRGRIAADPRTALAMLRPDNEGDAVTAALSTDRRLVLIRSAEAAVADLDRADALARAEAEAQAEAQRAIKVAELDLAISRGQAGYGDVDALWTAGDLSPAERTKFLKAVDKMAEEQQDLVLGAARVASAIGGGGIFLDPKNKEDRKHFNAYYERQVLPGLDGLPVEEAFGKISDVVARSGMVPELVQSQVRGALRSGDPATKAAAADFLARLAEGNSQALNDFAKEDISLGLDIAANLHAGVEPTDAVRLAEELRDQPPADAAALARQRREEDHASANESFLSARSAETVGTFTSDPDVPLGLVAEFDALQERYFARHHDLAVSQSRAWADLSRVWGVTEIGGGGRRWMRYAPEAFGPAGMDRAANAAWMQKQLLTDLSEHGAFDPTQGDLAERVALVSDGITARQVGAGDVPSYQIMLRHPESGAFQPLFDAEGNLQRWRPDWKTSAEYERLAAEQEKERAEELERAKIKRRSAGRDKSVTPPENVPGLPSFGPGENGGN